MQHPIYMDYHASTPVDPQVLQAMLPYFTQHYANAASRSHVMGLTANAAIENARLQVAQSIGAKLEEIIFTSGGTESNNLALLGLAQAYPHKKHFITTAVEHKSILETFEFLQKQGWDLNILPVDNTGRIDLAELTATLREDTLLVSVIAANNEIGTLAELSEIGKITQARGVFFHSDAVQAVGKINLDVAKMQIDLLSLSAHKCYGPKGVGALYVRGHSPAVQLKPMLLGGGHERGLRSGTLNVPGIVGLGAALQLAAQLRDTEQTRIAALRDDLQKQLTSAIADLKINGHATERLAGNLNICVPGLTSAQLLMELKDICLSTGSACSSGSTKTSYVLQAIGVDPQLAKSVLRFGLGRFTNKEEVEFVAKQVIAVVKKLRG